MFQVEVETKKQAKCVVNRLC